MLRTASISAVVLAATTLAVAAVRPAWQEMQMPKPVEQHQKLLQSVGDWEGTLTHFGPDGKATETRIKETIEPIGSFWTQSRVECEFEGQPFVGTGVMGYDVNKKQYVGSWVDSMSSHFAMMEGKLEGDKLVMRWQAPDMTGKVVPHRSETVHSGDSTTSTFYMGEGAGTKGMVIAMKRKGSKPVEAGAGGKKQ